MTDVTTVKADPKRPYKAYAATGLAFVGTFVSLWIADTDPFTSKEVAGALLSAAVTSGITGGVTFGVRNPKVPA